MCPFCRFVSVVILFVVLLRKHIPSFPKELFTPFPWIELKNLLKIGIPSAGEHMSYSLSFLTAIFGKHILGIGLGWGLVAMWAVFALDENIRGLIFVHRWNSFKWVGKGFLK